MKPPIAPTASLKQTNTSKESPPSSPCPCFLSLLPLFGISHFLRSIQLGRPEILHPIGRVEGLCRSPSLAPQVAEGTWAVNGALCTVFLRGGPLSPRSHLSQVPLRPRSTMPDCFCQVARFQARSEQRFPAKFRPRVFCFSSSHKGILSYCPGLRGGRVCEM